MEARLKAKEKAEELVGKYYFQVFNLNQQKQCAIIAVDEIEEALTDYGKGDSFQLQNMDSEF